MYLLSHITGMGAALFIVMLQEWSRGALLLSQITGVSHWSPLFHHPTFPLSIVASSGSLRYMHSVV